jgi:4-diphosphocytidyl-2-C-methyl-D-erythritol kinase
MSDGPVRLLAPAKLTTRLEIVGVRPDGFHELDAEMVSIDLADELVVDPAGDGLTIVASDALGASVSSGPDNLVARALRAVGRRAGVEVRKHIPVGGGLGGGSADAAAVLRWAGCADLAVAAGLGADVPFCLVGGRARVTGIGDLVNPLGFEPRSFVLLAPPFGVDTAAVYGAWDRRSEHEPEQGAGPTNGLTQAALEVEPRLAHWRDRLADMTRRPPVLAGSGSTWFVEGALFEFGLEGTETPVVGGLTGRVFGATAVPAGWVGPLGAGET